MNPIPVTENHLFHPKASEFALVIGVLNEGDKFTRQLQALQPYRKQVDILIADGGSTDGATAYDNVREYARGLLINRDSERGLSVQYRAAIAYALQEGYVGIIMMDGNGKDGVEAIPEFIAALNEGMDFVQGSRFMKGGAHENTPLDRVLGIRCVFNPLMYLASGYRYSDAMNGYKAVSRAFLDHPEVQPLRPCFIRYSLQYYLNYMAPRIGVRIREIPVSRRYHKQAAPHSKIIGIRSRLSILRELLGTITGQYNP